MAYKPRDFDLTVTCGYPYTSWLLRRGWRSHRPRHVYITQNGGEESACGWCKDKWGFSWQITPRRLLELTSQGGEAGKRAFQAMMTMRKIDIAKIESAAAGEQVDA